MTFEQIIQRYTDLLQDKQGVALEIDDSTVALFHQGKLMAAPLSVTSGIQLGKAYVFDPEFWDEDCGCWEGHQSASETMQWVNTPNFIPVLTRS
ncbi:hypothetical protein LCGC14_0170970 [marine sediment metagenome]|uniref:Uncharacterized protein n=1 Tax=marine sediment metagenome TaxID=412755 RepID=A0A0F9V8V4_9ZZZZ|tara:strand:+ start:56 stop:337 length:282 start_codon:yes stop_codon:yes gene_type:complete